jgi:hypothetical protein
MSQTAIGLWVSSKHSTRSTLIRRLINYQFNIKRAAATVTITTAIAAFTPHIFAADHTSSDNAFLEDIPVVLTASRLSQPVTQAPVAITIIDKK